MTSTTVFTLVDGTKVVAPNSLNLITPYVLREQEDWFEDEIKFLRRLLQPGEMVIDIGANYGVYTVAMARAVGQSGKVWAFEPASGTARLLAESIAANGFGDVTIETSALSNVAGTAQLRLEQQSELNALQRDESHTGDSETVAVVTLDDRMDAYDWREIAFVKIDAEGEETNILKGGERFFSALSPLVQYEIKAGADLHLDLAEAFARIGYDSYRLVPGLDLLIPFRIDRPPDGYLLNLFCCKPDRAARLADEGFLLTPASTIPKTLKQRLTIAWDRLAGRNSHDWRHTLATLPYGKQLANVWKQTVAAGHSVEVEEALSLFAKSRDTSVAAGDRFFALESSFMRLSTLCEREPTHLRLASLARVARDYGARSVAANALASLSDSIVRSKQIDPSEPFLVPAERFELISPGQELGDWVLAAVLEELERTSAYSSFYTGVAAKQRLEIIRNLGFGSAEMQRRLSLLYERFGLQSPQPQG